MVLRSGLVVSVIFLLAASSVSFGQIPSTSSEPTGAIKGTVMDRDTRTPLVGANVVVLGTQWGTTTNERGEFAFPHIPVGTWTLRFSFIGYETLTQTDLIVKSKRTVVVEVALPVTALESEAVTVTAGYFAQTQDQPTSVVNFSYEEIRRGPGSGGDVTRILMGLPSVAKVDDQINGLAVRGGSPLESGYYLDNIEIPNINHFPAQGASVGPVGLLNVDFIRDVDFHSGGFSALYGDRLSSIMDLSYREGNREELDGQADLSDAGLGAVAEGPLPGNKGSWLVSGRRSYLELLEGLIGAGVVPVYGDFQGKLVYDPRPNHRISLLVLTGLDHWARSREKAEDVPENTYGDYRSMQNTAGLNWRFLWGKKGYSQTSLAHTYVRYRSNLYRTATGEALFRSRTPEQILHLRNVNTCRFDASHRLEFGGDAQYLVDSYDNAWGTYTDPFGRSAPDLQVKDSIQAYKLGAFASFGWTPLVRLEFTLGGRADYFSYTARTHLAPRFSLLYRLTDQTALSAAAGTYYQNLPLVLLSQQAANKELEDPVAYHLVAGFSHLLNATTQLRVEAYYKTYRHLPIDPTQPEASVLDELKLVSNLDDFSSHVALVDQGRAWASGLEGMVQKKLATRLYGLLSGAYFRTRYRGLDGVWRNRAYDNRFLGQVEGGYKLNRKWEFSLRWIVAGGRPYTPFDLDASRQLNSGVLDEQQVNAVRLPDYHSLNFRADRRFNFRDSNLIVYVSVWNAYNRDNVAFYYWNEVENKLDEQIQLGLLPIMGIEYEF